MPTQTFTETVFSSWFAATHASLVWSGGGGGSAFFSTLGNGTATTFTLNHQLASSDVFVTAYANNTLEEIYPESIKRDDANHVTVTFTDPPASHSVRVVVWKHNSYATTFGNNSSTTFTITHNLGTRDVYTAVYNLSTLEQDYPDIVHATTNTVTLTFSDAPATNGMRIVVGNNTGTTYAGTTGNGTDTTLTVAHNLGTRDVVVSVYDASSYEETYPDIVHTDTNTLTLVFTDPPANNDVRVVAGTSAATGSGNLKVGVRYFSRAPVLYQTNDNGVLTSTLSDITSADELLTAPGWQLANYHLDGDFASVKTLKSAGAGASYKLVLVRDDGTTPLDTTVGEGWEVVDTTAEALAQEPVRAAVFYIDGTVSGETNPIIFATRSLFSSSTILRNGSLIGQSTFQGETGWLFSYTNNVLEQGQLSFIQTDVPWVPSNAVHVWLRPQRVNHIFNPSFEALAPPDNTVAFGWCAGSITGTKSIPVTLDSNGLGQVSWQVSAKQSVLGPLPSSILCTLTTERRHTIVLGTIIAVSGVGAPFDTASAVVVSLTPTSVTYLVEDTTVVAPTSTTGQVLSLENTRTQCGVISTVAASVSECLVASNFFPRLGAQLCASMYLRPISAAALRARVGALCWNDTFTRHTYVWGAWNNIPASGAYQRLVSLLDIPDDTVECQLVVHLSNPVPFSAALDNAAAEFSEIQSDYFDGETLLGARGDFVWVDPDGPHRSTSLWYNNLSNTDSRIFTHYDDVLNVQRPGLVEEWVPAGTQVIPHWYYYRNLPPALWVGDYREYAGDVSQMAVTPL